ncbi:GLPGLI family protein [Seonamhaeicola aphaedonensis]|uniref:GLPGLI family protein n=1 Tax=Seonamhaeicola aphaedonensis TaxID=1461338 RepID=A0A3D9HLL5_9FLAO|nr:GLPGLI family protein [Seonamhaeicola aphaedonensis]RED50387.1 GLPGLI family protein [Seonamhaeicola aphaedonensis]
MKKVFINYFILCLLVLTSNRIYSQDFQGKAYYMSKTTIDMANFGGGRMDEETKNRIAARMKSMLEKTFILTFNKSESIYKEEEKLKAPGTGGGGFRSMMAGNFVDGNQYKNIKDKTFLQEREVFGKKFLIKDSIPSFEWKMTGETKQIGQYTCFKAIGEKIKYGLDINTRRPRPEDESEEENTENEQETVEVIVWYTPQIPVSQGPTDYWGLPGLILEVSEGRTTILCSKIIMNPDEKDEIKIPSKGKEVSRAEFDEISKEKMEEMRQNFRRGGGRPGGGGGRR